ncbi:MAG: CRISPR-associated endonuclease Cas1 [Saprospiraceae bacterium]
MQLYLDSFGAYLSVRNGQFAVRTRTEAERCFAVRDVGAILLTKGTAMSTDAALLAAGHDIPVLLIDAQTHFPLAQLSHGRPGSIAELRRTQALWSRQAEGFSWVAQCTAEKIARQRVLLVQLAERPDAPPGFAVETGGARQVLAALERSFRQWSAPATWDADSMSRTAEQFRGQEGTASRLYFQQLAKHLAHRGYRFEGRQQRPAFDPFNALLNYLYGMLYTNVHLGLLKCGLDPYMGVLHADQWGARPTLAFDAIEPYRPWADAVALDLMTDPLFGADDAFQPDPDERGLWLAPAGKDRVIGAMLDFLNTTETYDRRRLRRSVHIDLDMQKIAALVRGVGDRSE